MPLLGRGKRENFGDLLSKYIVESISGTRAVYTHPKQIRWYEFNRKVYFASGSILHMATRKTIVWGSGMIQKTDRIRKAAFLAVRGPVTRNLLLKQGHDVPEVYGDPAILMRDIYFPETIKKYHLGIIPHFVDYRAVEEWYKSEDGVVVIDLLNNEVKPVLDQILSCRLIVTSSLHGLIVAHTYGIPAVWVQFSDKLYGDNMKFEDYMTSVGMNYYNPEYVGEKLEPGELENRICSTESLPDETVLLQIRKGLLDVCPFYLNRIEYK
ncbi:MAG: polysaccharide pyruvyl transferase family protein [Balneolaceae bacterium]|nr:MAG: polysaccharide pyruvyl transferase family protein [Balneolaceae bacterium]